MQEVNADWKRSSDRGDKKCIPNFGFEFDRNNKHSNVYVYMFCVCVHMYMCVCTCAHECVSAYVCVCMYVCMYMCACAHAHVCMYTSVTHTNKIVIPQFSMKTQRQITYWRFYVVFNVTVLSSSPAARKFSSVSCTNTPNILL
jgi:hypothetical protein